ncbi:MAG: hypothetical protein ACLU38_13525 [Dysosmobacter sp.]
MVEYNKNSTVTVGNITIKEQSDAKEMANTAKTEAPSRTTTRCSSPRSTSRT